MDSTEQDIEFKTYLDALAGRITATLTVRNLECLRRQHRNIQRERRLYHALGLPAPETVFEHLFNKLPVDNNSFERLNRFDRDGNPERKNRGNRVDGSRQNRFDRARNNFLDRDDDFYLTFTFNNRTRFNSQVRSESPPSSVAGSLASIDVGEKAFSFSQSQSESTSCCDHSASCGGPSASCDDHTPRKSILRHDIPDPYDDKTDFSFSRSTSSNDDSTDRTDRDTVSVYNGNTLNGIPKFKFRNGSSTRDRKSLDRFNVQFDSSYDLTYDGDDEHNSYEEGVERLKLNCGSPTSVYGLQSNNPSTSDDEVNALDKPDSTMVGFALPDCEMPKPVVPSAEHSAGAMAYESLIGSNPYIGSPDSSTYGVQETGWTDPRPYITSTLAAQEIDLTGPYDSLGEDYPYIGSYIDSYIDGPDSSTHGAQETDTSPTRHYPYIDGLDSNIYGNQEIDWTDPELFLQPKTYCRETDERDCTITPEPFEKTPDVTTPDESERPQSCASSFYEVRSLLSMSPKVVKAPVASFSPAIRSRVRNDEGSSSEGSQGKKRKSSATYASVRKRMFQPVSGGNLQMRKIPEDPEENSESELEPMPFIAPPPSRAPTPPFTPVASPGVQLNLRRRPSLIQQFGQKIMRLSSWMGSDKAVPKRLGEAQTAIYSLEISDQSKIYGTIDSMVCTTANKFLMKNYYAGRVSTESIAMVREHWKAQNRPQVLEFCFSQAIQQKLIFANRDTLQFAGAASTNPIVIDKIMTNWKMMAQDMGKRILCQPDSVVRKHINDTIDILKMLDATDDAIVNMQVMGVQVSKKLQDEFGKRLSQTTVGVLNSARRSHGQNSC